MSERIHHPPNGNDETANVESLPDGRSGLFVDDPRCHALDVDAARAEMNRAWQSKFDDILLDHAARQDAAAERHLSGLTNPMTQAQQLIIIAEATAKPGRADDLRRELTSMLAPSRAEPGCVSYVLHEVPGEPERFVFYEVWKDDAAFAFHERTPHYVALGPKVADLVAGPAVLRKLRVIG